MRGNLDLRPAVSAALRPIDRLLPSFRIAGIVLGEGARLVLWGLALGVPLAVAAALALRGSLYGMAPLDPWILSGAAVVLAVVTLAASSLPARQAVRIDPVRVMRQE